MITFEFRNHDRFLQRQIIKHKVICSCLVCARHIGLAEISSAHRRGRHSLLYREHILLSTTQFRPRRPVVDSRKKCLTVTMTAALPLIDFTRNVNVIISWHDDDRDFLADDSKLSCAYVVNLSNKTARIYRLGCVWHMYTTAKKRRARVKSVGTQWKNYRRVRPRAR